MSGLLMPALTFQVDKTAPAAPVTAVPSYNSSTKAITFSWAGSTDPYCLGCSGYACKYWIRAGWTTSAVATPAAGELILNNGEWSPPTNSYSNPSYTSAGLNCTGHDSEYAYFQVRQAKDDYAIDGNLNSDNETAEVYTWRSYQCPTPTLYPTVAITGTLSEDLGAICSSGIANPINPRLTPAYPQSITTDCGTTPATGTKTSYRCTITFNNQVGPLTPTPRLSQSFNLRDNTIG
jgi:hypothetical protein